MDSIEYQHKQALVKLNTFEILKIITQLIFSVSLFSIFFSQSFPHFFNRFHFHQFSHTIDKNYVFLLCNGLLVFLAKYSGLIRSLSSSNRNDEILKAYESISMSDSLMEERETPLFEREVSVERDGSAPDGELERETIYPFWEKDEEHTEEDVPFVEEEVEDEEGEGNEMLSAEELNRKFDEFIRKMKEEIRTEAQAQPQLVFISSN